MLECIPIIYEGAFTLLSKLMIDTLRQITHGIACQFGSNCEVVVHELNPDHPNNTIILIENEHVTHRKLGDGPSHIVLEAMKHDLASLEDKLSYLTRTHDGRILKSSTMYIRDETGIPAAILAINFDITGLLAVDSSIQSIVTTDATSSPEPESIPLNVTDLLEELISQSVKLVGKPVAMMTKEDKIRAIQFLNNSGAFLITKSGDKVSKFFNISKFTLYSYLDASKSE